MVDSEGRDLDAPVTDPTQRVSFVASANRVLLEQILKLVKI